VSAFSTERLSAHNRNRLAEQKSSKSVIADTKALRQAAPAVRFALSLTRNAKNTMMFQHTRTDLASALIAFATLWSEVETAR
jgi:hypothetical protein